jgi:hypothetical protein
MPNVKWMKLFFHIAIAYMAGNIFWSWYTCQDQLCVGDRGYYETDHSGQPTVDQFGRTVPAEGK